MGANYEKENFIGYFHFQRVQFLIFEADFNS